MQLEKEEITKMATERKNRNIVNREPMSLILKRCDRVRMADCTDYRRRWEVFC